MKTTVATFIVISLVAAVSTSTVFADDAALKALDTDHDGTVSLGEAQAAASKVFAKLNSDKDATLDAKELGDRIDAAGLKTADPDNDGKLNAEEYANLVATKFKAADVDGDGTLDAKELNSPAGAALLKLVE
jgi:Ca2+-binding EF-hand superfamily protein